MNKLSKYPLFLLFTALAVTITARDFVTDGAPDTRATDNDRITTFENDDRVGIIILDNKDTPLYNNIPYKYVSSSRTWAFDSNNGEGKEICYYDSKAHTYIVYYPYNKDADNCKSESDLKAIFKPQTDQSREAGRDFLFMALPEDLPPPTALPRSAVWCRQYLRNALRGYFWI